MGFRVVSLAYSLAHILGSNGAVHGSLSISAGSPSAAAEVM